MNKADSFSSRETYLDFFFHNETEDRKSPGWKGEDDWHHYDLFRRVATFLCDECNFTPSAEPYPELVSKDYPGLWRDCRWGENKYLRWEGHRYPHGFEFDFYYQNSRTGNRCGGAYDIDKGHYAKPLELFTFRLAVRKVAALMRSLGIAVEDDREALRGREWVMWKINEDPDRHWGKWETYKDEPYHKNSNARDRDEKLVKNGQVKYFRDWHGRLARGEVYHNINNMWWVVLNEDEYTNVACFDLFDATAEDFRVRRLVRDRANEQEKVRRQIGTKQYNDLVAKGIKLGLTPKEAKP